MRLVLASTSPYRRQLLERLGVPFECVAPDVDERAALGAGLAPVELAILLAKRKALAVSGRRPGALVIGSDQVCALDGRVLDKPGDPERNLAQLTELAGRTHELCTAVCIARDAEPLREFVDRTRLTMRPLDRARLARYVARDRAIDCAGGYKLEAAGAALFERVETADPTAIIGLPLMRLCIELDALGVPLP
ncbi:MAG: septum formation protein Maf [Planctomycetes bacterium]|nr:septum formation protein Maf [Planctomycetota bacterium]